MNVGDQHERVRRRLRIVRWAGWIDLILLVTLVTASQTGNRELVRVLGPLHGINFLVLVTIVSTAAVDGMWSWWFPVAVLFTGGPIGALAGDWIVSRGLAHPVAGAINSEPSPANSGNTTATPSSIDAHQATESVVPEGSRSR